jgi:hypothetical protein
MYCLLRFQTMAVTTHLVTKTGTGVTDPAELHCCMMNLDRLMCYTVCSTSKSGLVCITVSVFWNEDL